MNSKLLSFLEEIKVQGNMSKAAQALYVTQPYISRVIKNAEVQFGVTLIDRSLHPIQLTYAVERLLKFLQEEAKLRSNLDREMTHLSDFKYGHLTIASNEIVVNDIYKPILTRFYKAYPNVHAQVLRLDSRKAEKRLLAGSLDFFVGHPLHASKISYKPIANVPLVLVIPKSAKAFQENKLYLNFSDIDRKKLNDTPFVSTPSDDNYQKSVVNFFNDAGVSPEYSVEVPDLKLATGLAILQLGMTITTDAYVNLESLSEEERKNIYLVRIPRSRLSTNFGISFMNRQQIAEPVSDLMVLVTDVDY